MPWGKRTSPLWEVVVEKGCEGGKEGVVFGCGGGPVSQGGNF